MRSSIPNTLPATSSRPSTWPGHLEITSKSLLSILERAAGGASDFSIAERSLFMACEFWAATKSRTLAGHLGADALETLQTLGTIFATMGAVGVAGELDAAAVCLSARRGEMRRQHCISGLQDRLLVTAEPVDTLLARFAVELFGNVHARRRRAANAAYS